MASDQSPHRPRIKTRPARRPRRSLIVRILRTIFLAIVIAFVFGFIVGTFLRRGLDRPVRYMGDHSLETTPAISVGATDPGDVRDTLSGILMSRDHEEQVA